MNKYVRLFFLPIMLLAGVFTSAMCALVIAPVVLVHWLRSFAENRDDVAEAMRQREQLRRKFYGEEEALELGRQGR